MTKICGIYKITNKANDDKSYIGKSVNVYSRLNIHKNNLLNGTHFNKHLQNSFNLYGENSFNFALLEECNIDELSKYEQNAINKHKPNIYNKALDVINFKFSGVTPETKLKLAESNRGIKNPFYGKKHTNITKNKMSKSKIGKYEGKNNPNYGKINAPETKVKMSLGRSKSLDGNKIKEIVNLLKKGEPHKKIAEVYSVERTTITRISNGARWTNITGGPVIPIIRENGKRIFSNAHKQRIGSSRHAYYVKGKLN